MEEISGSSHRYHGQAGPAQVKMSAGEIVKLLPRLSPGLSQELRHFLERSCKAKDVVRLTDFKVAQVLDRVRQDFAAELEALARSGSGGARQGSSSDVILQLSFCLLLALAPSLPNARGISIWGGKSQTKYGGEQAVEVLYSALESQLSSNYGVRHLAISSYHSFGSDGGCKHLARLLESGHCKLQRLQVWGAPMGAVGMRHIARALQKTNSSLTVLEIHVCREVGDGAVVHLAAMLRTNCNSSLQELTLKGIGMTVRGLGYLCEALSTQQSLPSPSGWTTPNGHLGGLKKLDVSENEIGEGGTALLGDMLAQNRCLQSLKARACSLVEKDGQGHLAEGLRENSTLQELDISNNPKLDKVALGLLVRCLATNNTTSLKTLHIGNWGEISPQCSCEMPAAEELARMIAHNQSLVDLGLQGASYDAREWATVILPAIGRNRTLLSINLNGCLGVGGDEVEAALFELLRINTTIQKIDLDRTPFYHRDDVEAVRVELHRNVKLRHALSALPQAKPKSCRIVLCGHAYAGKSSLLQAMKLLQPNSTMSSLKASELSEQTRGTEIHLLKDETDCRISVWDLAGHREFHALHDIMFPRGNNAATLFVLTFSPIVSPVDEQRAGEVKQTQELEEELLYWLRFLVSKSKPSAAAPTVMVVITHKDTLHKLVKDVESWLRHVEKNIIPRLATDFSGPVKVNPLPFMVNALASHDVELNKWVEEVEKSLKSTLESLHEEPAICTQALKAVQEVSRNRTIPMISRGEFGNICRSLAPDVEVDMARAVGQAYNEPESLAIVGDKIGTTVGAYLHDAGEIIHHDKLDFIVSNPKWFCEGVLGQLVDLFPSSQKLERPKNGLVTKDYISNLLHEALKSVLGSDPTVVTPEQLIQLMLSMDLCYEKTPGDPNTDYFLPTIFDDDGNKAGEGKRPLTWRPRLNASTFVGRRLQCADRKRTFLTDGFFPRLQVELHNHALEKWTGAVIMLDKNLFSIWVNGMEILIEFSGSSGYFVDILVKSSTSHENTMEFLRPNIVDTIYAFCASQEGCQGMTLAQAIIRPECLYRADGNPILCIHRRDQSVLVQDLRKMRSTLDWQHTWDKVEDGAGRVVLLCGRDLGKVLLDGPKDVASRAEPNLDQVDESCYPSTWKPGGRRGLALIVSMEKRREGGEGDRGRLEGLVRACGFSEVVVLVDPKAPEIREKINLVVDDVLHKDDCFLCSINAHGGTQDGKPYILDENKSKIMVLRDIIEPFLRSEHLQGKPKVFLINCCREEMLYDNSDNVEVQHADAQKVTGSLPRTEFVDCLLVFSTTEGFPSYRKQLAGTAFVSQLMETVTEKKETADVMSMMTMVSKGVREATVGQCCESRSFLLKKLYWKGT